MKTIYYLGKGDFQKGMERLLELEKERHEHEMRINPALAFFEELQKSENPVHRMFTKFLLQGGMSLPTKDAIELQDKLLREENYKSAKQLPASANALPSEKVSKKGPHKYSDAEKLNALRDWDKLDKTKFPINVRDWLIERFGEDGGFPNVPKSTFYGWKKPLKDKGLLD